MQHILLDRWSQRTSPLHRRDPRVKILVTLVFLVLLATTPAAAYPVLAIYAVLAIAAILIARLPLGALLSRALIVLPFSLTFAVITWLTGDKERAVALVEKTYLSVLAAHWLAGATPLPSLLAGLERLGCPRLLILVAQFLYRYVFVLSEQARNMRLAAACRKGTGKIGFRAASGALAVLFARSYQRAEGIHRAMRARGFAGRFSMLNTSRFNAADGVFLALVSAFLIVVRWG